MVEDALLAQEVEPPVELVPSSEPGPRMLRVVLVARYAVERVVRVAEVIRHADPKRRAARHVRNVDTELAVAREGRAVAMFEARL